VHFKLRLPVHDSLKTVAVNGRPVTLGGAHKDTVMIETKNQRKFEVVGQLG